MKEEIKKFNEDAIEEKQMFIGEVSVIMKEVEPCMNEAKGDIDYFRGKIVSFTEKIKCLENIKSEVNNKLKEYDKKIFDGYSDLDDKISEAIEFKKLKEFDKKIIDGNSDLDDKISNVFIKLHSIEEINKELITQSSIK